MDDTENQKTWLDRLSEWLLREPKDREQLLALLKEAKDNNILDPDAFRMIEGVMQVSEMQVRDVMVPRSQMIVIDGNATPTEAIPTIIESAHSRFPVIGESRDEILGILLAKDLLPFNYNDTKTHLPMRDLVRPAVFVPESKRLNVLLKEFRINRNHMAIVVDEYGGISGLVTIEDLLEEIVGEIEDEYDVIEEPNIKNIRPQEYLVKALTSIEEFNHFFHTQYSEEDFDTIGGLVLQKFSHLPKRGETIAFDNFSVTVMQASKRGIQLLKFQQLAAEEN